MKCVTKFIKSLDQFGAPIQFNYKTERDLKTQFGGLFTILGVIVVVVLSYLLGQDLFNRRNPILRFSKAREPSQVNLTNFPIFFSMGNIDRKKFIDINKIITVDLTLNEFVSSDSGRVNVIKHTNLTSFGPCDLEKDFGVFKETMNSSSNAEKSSIFCVKSDPSAVIRGVLSSINSSHVFFNIKKCNPKTQNKTCFNKTVLDEYLSNFMITMFYFDYDINPKDFKKPYEPAVFTLNTLGGLGSFKQRFISLKNTYVTTDDGWVSPNPTTKVINQFSKSDLDFSTGTNDPDDLAVFLIGMDNYTDHYDRSYIKLTDIFVSLGGLLNIITVIGKLLCCHISEISFNLQLAQEFLDFKDLEEKSSEPNRSIYILSSGVSCDTSSSKKSKSDIVEMNETKVISHKSDFNLVSQTKDTEAVDHNKLLLFQKLKDFNKSKKKETKLGRNYLNYCSYLPHSCDSSLVSEFYSAINHYYTDQLDISKILRQLLNLEIMKFILFEEKDDNYSIFNYKIPSEDIIVKYEQHIHSSKVAEELEDSEEPNKIENSLAYQDNLKEIIMQKRFSVGKSQILS